MGPLHKHHTSQNLHQPTTQQNYLTVTPTSGHMALTNAPHQQTKMADDDRFQNGKIPNNEGMYPQPQQTLFNQPMHSITQHSM